MDRLRFPETSDWLKLAIAAGIGSAASYFSAALADMAPSPVEAYLRDLVLGILVVLALAGFLLRRFRRPANPWVLVAVVAALFLLSEVLIQHVYPKR